MLMSDGKPVLIAAGKCHTFQLYDIHLTGSLLVMERIGTEDRIIFEKQVSMLSLYLSAFFFFLLDFLVPSSPKTHEYQV